MRRYLHLLPVLALIALTLSSCGKQEEEVDPLLMEDKGPKWGFINHSGKFVIAPKFARVSKFSEGLAAADKHNRWGYIDRKGEFVIPRQFSFAKAFSAGYAPVQMDGKWGAINKKGDIVFPCVNKDVGRPHEVDPDAEDHAVLLPYRELDVKGLGTPELWGFHDFGPHGKGDIRPQWNKVKHFNDGLCPVYIETKGRDTPVKKWGYINNVGVLVIDYKFDEASVFKNRVAECMMGDDFVWVDKIGTIAKKSRLESLQVFRDGVAVQPSRKKTFIFINRKGKPAFKKRFHYADNFSEGLAVVQPVNMQKRGYIDTRGNMVISPRFDDARAFSEQLAAVRVDPDVYFKTHNKDGTPKRQPKEEKDDEPDISPDEEDAATDGEDAASSANESSDAESDSEDGNDKKKADADEDADSDDDSEESVESKSGKSKESKGKKSEKSRGGDDADEDSDE